MKALEGLRVIDLTQAMAAPFCSMNLADMGADVIKVEPPTGEDMRRGSVSRNGHSGTFLTINRGKRGITVDLKQPAGVQIIHRLVKTADVFVQNYRPGAAKRLGVDYETLAAINPRLIYCSISGFGSTGPYAARGGYDLIAQGMSGIISVTGDEDGPPAKAGLPVSDLSAGLFGAYGILCALEHRERTGHGQFVDTSLLEAALALTVWEATECAIERPDLAADARFTGIRDRIDHRDALIAEIERTTAKEARAHWLARLDHAGVPAGPINTYPEALADPHALARDMVVDLDHPGAGPIKALGVPVKLSDTPGAVDRAAPLLGQDNAAVLTELGYTDAEQRALKDHGVI